MTSDIFVLTDKDGELLDPNVQATVLAKYSRSALSAKEVVGSISEESADKFHEKWVISYGHSSVAELATLPVCFEGVSMVATKFIESFPRAGYSEKSTRYQKFTKDSFITPPGMPSTMKEFVGRFFDAYEALLPEAEIIALEKFGLEDNEANRKLGKVKARAFDMLRGLLPAGTGTNLAGVYNLRDLRYLVQQARAHGNSEIREIGEKVFKTASQFCPSLLKEALPDTFEPRIKTIGSLLDEDRSFGVYLKDYDRHGYMKVQHYASTFYGMNWDLFSSHMSTRGNQQVPSVFKIPRITLKCIMDFGAYRDLQRHRRCEQYTEPLTPYLGYDIPDDVRGSRIEFAYRKAMESVLAYGDEEVSDPEYYQYIIPMGYYHRSIFSMDLRELYYIVELRTKPQGHMSYRRIAYGMYEKALQVYPELMAWCRAINPEVIGEHN
jgi:thymidylate synthase ThyX